MVVKRAEAGRTFMGWEQTSVTQCLQLLTDSHIDPQSSCGAADRQAAGTEERCGGLENGSGEVKKTAEKRTVWMKGTKVSYTRENLYKLDFFFSPLSPHCVLNQLWLRHAAEQRTSVVRSDYILASVLRNRPWTVPAELTRHMRRYRKLF